MKNKWLIVLGVSMIAIAAIGLYFVTRSGTSRPPSGSMPLPINLPANTSDRSADIALNWAASTSPLTSTFTTAQFSFKYPQILIPHEIDGVANTMQMGMGPDFALTIQGTSDGQANPSATLNTWLAQHVEGGRDTYYQYLQLQVKDVPGMYLSSTTIGGEPAIEISVHCDQANLKNDEAKNDSISVVHKGYYYTINEGDVCKDPEGKTLADRILATFKFTK